MGSPGFYPHEVSNLERRDTHISSVFLTGRWVYKLKKPLDFGFLDFGSLEDRHRFCQCEVSLNRRLSQGVYEDVVAIRQTEDGGLNLEGRGKTVEYAVKMRQLPDDAGLDRLLARNRTTSEDMRKLGRTLAAFYETAQRGPDIDRYGSREAISFNVEENFRQLEPFVDRFPDREKWDLLCQVSRHFLEHHPALFQRRVDEGRIRDGHGDLRAEHVYFQDGIQIIDCIEFNDRFRYGDVALDLAFLHSDMEHQGHGESSRAVLAAYAEGAGDPGLYAVLDFYAAYRAVVRLKVACFRSEETEGEEKSRCLEKARTYLDQAYRYAVQFGLPTLWVFCGLPASGKSTLAEATADALSLSVFESDRVRKEEPKEGAPQVSPFGEGPYREAMRHRVYARLLARAQDQLKSGRSVVLDATFSRRKWREDARRLARDVDANLVFVECVCAESTLRSRMEAREKEPGLSDARLRHLPRMIAAFEPPVECTPSTLVRVSTDRSPREALGELLAESYARRSEQVMERIGKT